VRSTTSSVSGRGTSTSGVTSKLERPEFAPASQVGDRLAREAALRQGLEREQLLGPERPARVGRERRAGDAEHLRDQNLGVERGGIRDAGEPIAERGERISGAGHSSAASSSAWCSRASASTTSSSAPSTMLSSL
jgi:hypothetical protein